MTRGSANENRGGGEVRPPVPTNANEPIDVQTLLRGGTEVRLVHRGVEYRLRVTRQGKLLLTK